MENMHNVVKVLNGKKAKIRTLDKDVNNESKI